MKTPVTTFKVPILTACYGICYIATELHARFILKSSGQNKDLKCNRICKLWVSKSCLGAFLWSLFFSLNYQFLHCLLSLVFYVQVLAEEKLPNNALHFNCHKSALHFYGLLDNGFPEMAKSLPASHKHFCKQNF